MLYCCGSRRQGDDACNRARANGGSHSRRDARVATKKLLALRVVGEAPANRALVSMSIAETLSDPPLRRRPPRRPPPPSLPRASDDALWQDQQAAPAG